MKTLVQLEREHLVAALVAANGVLAQAAKLLGITRWAMARKVKLHDIGPPDWHPDWQNGGET